MARDIGFQREAKAENVRRAIINLAVFMATTADEEFVWSEVMNEIAADIEEDLKEIEALRSGK